MCASFVGSSTAAAPTDLGPARYSSLDKLIRITGWCRRFARRARRKPQPADSSQQQVPVATKTGSVVINELSAEELQQAERLWISQAQQDAYPEVFKRVLGNKELLGSDALVQLRPTMDQSHGIPVMRVGGRLQTSHHLPGELRSPTILPPRHRVTQLVIGREDDRCRHSVGPNHLLSNLADKFWIVRGKMAVRSHRHACVKCRRTWARTANPVMGQLPVFRTAPPLQTFSRVGIDFAGPFHTRQGRGRTQLKRYVCVFKCLQTGACHLEVVNSLDVDGFLLCFTRLCKRRGTPKEVLSDNGTNFVAAERELREAWSQASEQAGQRLATQGIKWLFNPPLSPHFGGYFECLVKAMKKALQSLLYRADLTDEELQTALIQAEALLNSRPLTVVSSDADDPAPLTPLHFLVGHQDVSAALEDVADAERVVHPHRRWKYVQRLTRDVWSRWLKEVVPKLNVRSKWHRREQNVKVGDVMIVLEKHTPRIRWPLERVKATYPGEDGVVRVVDIKINGKIYRRSVGRLVPLEVPDASPANNIRSVNTGMTIGDITE